MSSKGRLAKAKLKAEDILQQLIKHDAQIKNEYSKDPKKTILIGVDEVGRGCLAGPVCTGAYSCEPSNFISFDEGIELLNDSKKVPHAKRHLLYEALMNSSWSFNMQTAKTIDRIGIVPSIWLSMTENICKILNETEQKVEKLIILVDGPKTIPDLDRSVELNYRKIQVKQIAIKKGDSKSALIAAASNIAKYKRDEYMQKLAEKYPDYGWDTNVGYGSKKHRDAINKHGTNKYHRKSFLSNILSPQLSLKL